MLKNALKSTSVVALCTALMTPPVLAQDAEENLEECTVTGPFPCVTENGVRVESAMELAKETLMPSEAEEAEQAETAPEEPETPAEPATPDAPGQDVADETPAADAPGRADAQAEAEVEAEAEAQADDEGLVENLANDLVDAGEEAADTVQETAEQAGDAVEQTAEDAADAAEQTAEDAADTAEAAADAAEEEAGDAAQELAEELPADETVEAEAEATAEAEAEAEATSDEDALADALEEDANAEAEATAEAEAEASDEEMTAGERIEEETSAETAQAPSAPEEPMEDQAPEAAAAADAEAEATDEDMASDEDVVVEEVTEAEARSSGEEFETTATVTEEAAASNNGGNNNGSGLNRQLTDFEKLVLAGLGGIAVGTILANGKEIVSNSGDRIVVQNPDGTYQVLKNDDTILRQPGVVVSTKSYNDGSTRTVVERDNGVRIVTIRAADGTVLKRTRVMPNGDQYVLFDDTVEAQPVSQQDVQDYEPIDDIRASDSDEAALREALMASMDRDPGRTYSLRQVRQFSGVRDLAPVIEVDAITFDTGSAVIRSGQAEELAALGQAIRSVIEERPDAVFLIEGHTDAVGGAAYNLALSDRRAESVALALTEYFDVPPENMITQGYGESELKIVTSEAERQNRRANVRNITPLLQ